MSLPASAPKLIRELLVVAAMALLPVQVGCARPSPTTPPSAAAPTAGAEALADTSRLEMLEDAAQRRERRIRELESRLAMADAQVQELRDEARAREDELDERQTVRIGEPARRAAPEPELTESEDSREESPEDTGPRPVLRLYGPPQLPPAAYAQAPIAAAPMPTAAAPVAQYAPMVPQYIPSAPVATGLGPLPVVAPPGIRSMVPPIPDRPLQVLPAPPAPMLAAAAPRAGTSTTDDPAVREYQTALGHVASRRFDEALAGLGAFLRAHPQHPYADNAMFWRGEVLYMRHDYAAAERELAEMVRRFPRGNKVADALLRLGFCRQRQGDAEGARAYFRRVRTEHPDTVAARLASREDT